MDVLLITRHPDANASAWDTRDAVVGAQGELACLAFDCFGSSISRWPIDWLAVPPPPPGLRVWEGRITHLCPVRRELGLAEAWVWRSATPSELGAVIGGYALLDRSARRQRVTDSVTLRPRPLRALVGGVS